MPERLLTMPEAAARLGVSVARCYAMVRAKLLPAVHLGRSVRVSEPRLQAWIDAGGRPLEDGWKHRV